MAFKHVAGILGTEDKEKFARIVFRASSGHAIVRFADIAETLIDAEGAPHAKTVFAVFFRGRTLAGKLARICAAFSAVTHDIPNFAHEGEVAAALDETKAVIADSIVWLREERGSSSATLRHLALLLRKWRLGILREKAIAHTLNCCTRAPDRGTVAAQAWVLKTAVAGLRDTLQSVHAAAAEGGRLPPFYLEVMPAAAATTTPPTHFNTNRCVRRRRVVAGVGVGVQARAARRCRFTHARARARGHSPRRKQPHSRPPSVVPLILRPSANRPPPSIVIPPCSRQHVSPRAPPASAASRPCSRASSTRTACRGTARRTPRSSTSRPSPSCSASCTAVSTPQRGVKAVVVACLCVRA